MISLQNRRRPRHKPLRHVTLWFLTRKRHLWKIGTSWKILVCRIVLCQTFTFVTVSPPWAFHDIFDIFPMWSLIKIIFEFSAFSECTLLCVMLIVIKIKSRYSGVALFVVYFCHEYLIKSYHCLIIVRRTLPTKGSCSRGLVWRRSPPTLFLSAATAAA